MTPNLSRPDLGSDATSGSATVATVRASQLPARRGGVRLARFAVGLLLTQALSASFLAAQVPTPESHFGFRLGSDRRLATAEAIGRYFAVVAARSDRVKLIDVGPTTDGRATIAAIISAPRNIA